MLESLLKHYKECAKKESDKKYCIPFSTEIDIKTETVENDIKIKYNKMSDFKEVFIKSELSLESCSDNFNISDSNQIQEISQTSKVQEIVLKNPQRFITKAETFVPKLEQLDEVCNEFSNKTDIAENYLKFEPDIEVSQTQTIQELDIKSPELANTKVENFIPKSEPIDECFNECDNKIGFSEGFSEHCLKFESDINDNIDEDFDKEVEYQSELNLKEFIVSEKELMDQSFEKNKSQGNELPADTDVCNTDKDRISTNQKRKTNRTKRANSLKRHKKPEDIDTLQCSQCSYIAKRKECLKNHMTIHMRPEDIKMIQCNHCAYKAKRKCDLKRHMIIHMKPEDSYKFQSGQCSYKAKRRTDLKRHNIVHLKPDNVDMFQCNHCSYKTKRKDYLNYHLKIHMNLEDIDMFRCNYFHCPYKARRKDNLNRHKLTHTKYT